MLKLLQRLQFGEQIRDSCRRQFVRASFGRQGRRAVTLRLENSLDPFLTETAAKRLLCTTTSDADAMWMFLTYYVIGIAFGLCDLLTSGRKPADRLSIVPRLGVWAYLVGTSALLWPLSLLALAFRALGNTDSSDKAKPRKDINAIFAAETNGLIRLARSSRVEPVMLLIFLLTPWAFVVGCWMQERRLSWLFLYSILFAVSVTALMSMSVRRWWFARDGLRVEDGELIWTETAVWTPQHFRVPLRDIARVRLIETDPVHFNKGMALILEDDSTWTGNLHPRLESADRAQVIPSHFGIDPTVPCERIIIWTDDNWEWEPEDVVVWLKARGVSV